MNGLGKSYKRRLVWQKTGGVCAHCGKKKYGKEQQTIDHYVPKSRGGTGNIKNLMPLCKKCNKERGDKAIDPFAFYIYAPKYACSECIRYEKEYFKDCDYYEMNMIGRVIMRQLH